MHWGERVLVTVRHRRRHAQSNTAISSHRLHLPTAGGAVCATDACLEQQQATSRHSRRIKGGGAPHQRRPCDNPSKSNRGSA
eukprot:2760547-Pleurochrysis_carterae.AAC.1